MYLDGFRSNGKLETGQVDKLRGTLPTRPIASLQSAAIRLQSILRQTTTPPAILRSNLHTRALAEPLLHWTLLCRRNSHCLPSSPQSIDDKLGEQQRSALPLHLSLPHPPFESLVLNHHRTYIPLDRPNARQSMPNAHHSIPTAHPLATLHAASNPRRITQWSSSLLHSRLHFYQSRWSSKPVDTHSYPLTSTPAHACTLSPSPAYPRI